MLVPDSATPLYLQLDLLKKNILAILGGRQALHRE